MKNNYLETFRATLLRAGVTENERDQWTEDVSEYLSGNGIINLDAEDLDSLFREAETIHSCSGIGHGPDGAQKAMDMVWDAAQQHLKQADSSIVSVVISPSAGLESLETITVSIRSMTREECTVIYAVRYDPMLGDELTVRILAVCGRNRGA